MKINTIFFKHQFAIGRSKIIMAIITLLLSSSLKAQNEFVNPNFFYDDSLINALCSSKEHVATNFKIHYITVENDTDITYLMMFDSSIITAYKIYDSKILKCVILNTSDIGQKQISNLYVREFENKLVFNPPLSFDKYCKTSVVHIGSNRYLIQFGKCEYELDKSKSLIREAYFKDLELLVNAMKSWEFYSVYER